MQASPEYLLWHSDGPWPPAIPLQVFLAKEPKSSPPHRRAECTFIGVPILLYGVFVTDPPVISVNVLNSKLALNRVQAVGGGGNCRVTARDDEQDSVAPSPKGAYINRECGENPFLGEGTT